jgi:hypothetical protein
MLIDGCSFELWYFEINCRYWWHTLAPKGVLCQMTFAFIHQIGPEICPFAKA